MGGEFSDAVVLSPPGLAWSCAGSPTPRGQIGFSALRASVTSTEVRKRKSAARGGPTHRCAFGQWHHPSSASIDFINRGGLNQAGIDRKPTGPRFPLLGLRAWLLRPSTMGDPGALFLAGARRAKTCQIRKGPRRTLPKKRKGRHWFLALAPEKQGWGRARWAKLARPPKSGTAPGAHNAKAWPIRGYFRRTIKSISLDYSEVMADGRPSELFRTSEEN